MVTDKEKKKCLDGETMASLIEGYTLMSPINLEMAMEAETSDSEAWEIATEILRSVKNGDC